jgi:nucleoside-diphosphate-sugar epimerase
MKILITGLTGFVGKNLLKRNLGEHEYFTIARGHQKFIKNVEVLEGDLNNIRTFEKGLKETRPDVCLHLAWEGIPDYGYETSHKNFNAGVDFFRFLVQECGCRKIVSTGSCWEYGKNFGPCREDELVAAGGYFPWAKRALCDLGMSLADGEKIKFIWLRFFYIYGPGQRAESLVPSLARTLMKGGCPQVKNPLNANDFIYVDDACEALMKAAFMDVPSGIYNVGSGISLPVWRVCEMMENVLAEKVLYAKQLQASGGNQTANFWADTGKSRSILQWSAQTAMDVGIKEYLRGLKEKA